MKRVSRLSVVIVGFVVLTLIACPSSSVKAASATTSVLGYIGPGAGLGFLGSLFAVLVVVFLGLLGLVLYPLKLAIRGLRRLRTRAGLHGAAASPVIGAERA